MTQNVYFQGSDYIVTADYTPPLPGIPYTFNGDGTPDDPAEIIFNKILLQDCDPDGNNISIDVTSTLRYDMDFFHACENVFSET